MTEQPWQTIRYNYGDTYRWDNEFVKNVFSQLDYLINNSPIETNIIMELNGHESFGWEIKYTTWEQLNKPLGQKMLGDGITTIGLIGANYASTTFYDFIGFETPNGRQSPLTTLYHEAGHAFIKMKMYDMFAKGLHEEAMEWLGELSNKAEGFIDFEEKFVNDTYEVPLANTLGEGKRSSDWGNKKYQTAGPLTNQAATYIGPYQLIEKFFKKNKK